VDEKICMKSWTVPPKAVTAMRPSLHLRKSSSKLVCVSSKHLIYLSKLHIMRIGAHPKQMGKSLFLIFPRSYLLLAGVQKICPHPPNLEEAEIPAHNRPVSLFGWRILVGYAILLSAPFAIQLSRAPDETSIKRRRSRETG